jgi:phage gpG-like protein
MAGIADRYTFEEFVRRARQGAFTPTPGAGPTAVTPPGAPVRLPEAVGKQVGQIVITDIKTRITRGVDVAGRAFRPLKHARVRGGAQPLRDTGRLLASFTARVEPAAVVVGTMHPGAAIHDAGGVIRAKGKMLAIPLTREAQRSGGPRRFGKKKDLQLRGTKKRRVFVLGVEDKRGEFVGQFLLVDQVTIPQREFMGVSDNALGQIAEVLALSGFRVAGR